MKSLLPKLPSIHIKPASNGGFAVEHHPAGAGGLKAMNPKKYVFPNGNALMKHIAKTVKLPWLGNKTGTPRLRGAGHTNRVKEVETSSY